MRSANVEMFRSLKGEPKEQQFPTSEAKDEAIRRRLGDDDLRTEHLSWSAADWLCPESAAKSPTLKYSDFKNMITETRFTDDDQFDTLVSWLENYNTPSFPLAHGAGGTFYHLMPSTTILTPDKESEDPRCFYLHIVDINLNVQPVTGNASHRQQNLSQSSTQPGQSDDPEEDGFVFFQLGALATCTTEKWNGID